MFHLIKEIIFPDLLWPRTIQYGINFQWHLGDTLKNALGTRECVHRQGNYTTKQPLYPLNSNAIEHNTKDEVSLLYESDFSSGISYVTQCCSWMTISMTDNSLQRHGYTVMTFLWVKTLIFSIWSENTSTCVQTFSDLFNLLSLMLGLLLTK